MGLHERPLGRTGQQQIGGKRDKRTHGHERGHRERRVLVIKYRDEPAGRGTRRHLDTAGRGAGGAGNLRQGLHRALHRIWRDQPNGEVGKDQQ